MIDALIGVAGLALDTVAVTTTAVLLNLVAVGGLVGAGAVVVLKWTRRVPAWLASVLVPVLIAASVGSYFFMRGQESERVRTERARLEAVIAEQARQRAAAEKIAENARARAVEREQERDALQGKVDAYETGLASGRAKHCPDDDDPTYRRSMRSIRIGDPPRPRPARPRPGPDHPLPRSRP